MISKPASFSWPLTQFAEGLWTASIPIRFAGAWFPHVMTVLRLNDKSLLLHSPCELSDDIRADLRALGTVEQVVAPNWFHDLYLTEYRRAFPNATFWAPPLLQKLRRTRLINRSLDETVATPWVNLMPHLTLHGPFTFDESIFFHEPTKTLIVADLLMNLFSQPDTPWPTRLAYRISGLDNRLAVFPLLPWFSLTNRDGLRGAINRMLRWKPERIIVGHGEPKVGSVQTDLLGAFRWLLG